MESTTVRINPKAHTMLRRIARQAEESMQISLTKAIELYRRQIFLQKANVAFESLRKNPKAWKDELKEREDWDSILLDGVKDS